MSEHNFSRKALSGGEWPGPSHGSPTLTSRVSTALPGKGFIVCMDAGNVKFIFEANLSEGEAALLASAYDAWDPNTGVKRAYAESELKYVRETTVSNRLSMLEYYAEEFSGASGFLGFSGLGRIDGYDYSGNRFLGFSSVRIDSEGIEVERTYTSAGIDDNGRRIYRKG